MTNSRSTVAEAGRVIVLAAVLGFAYNAFSPKGIPLVRTEVHGPSADVAAIPTKIELEEARGLFEQGTALFLDARHEEDYMLGHISGARSLPVENLQQHLAFLRAIPKDALIVTYCGGEDCGSSTDLAYKLAELGYTNVKVFFAGWGKWLEHNLPVETGPPTQ